MKHHDVCNFRLVMHLQLDVFFPFGVHASAVRVAGHVVNEEVMEVTAEADQWGEIEDSEDELDPKQVTIGRQEELEFMVGRLSMFEFGNYEEAIQ